MRNCRKKCASMSIRGVSKRSTDTYFCIYYTIRYKEGVVPEKFFLVYQNANIPVTFSAALKNYTKNYVRYDFRHGTIIYSKNK
jgi:hypothetical protein